MFSELHKRRQTNILKREMRNIFLNNILKLATSERLSGIQESLDNLLLNKSVVGIIQDNYLVEIGLVGATLNVNVTLTYTDILRTIVFNIIVQEQTLTIQEL